MSEGIESKLGAILSDPSAMAGIMNIVKGLSGDTKPHEGGDTYESKADADKSRDSIPAAVSYPNIRPKPKDSARNIGLLCALRPFLCEERAKKLDVIIEIMKIVDLTELFKVKEE